MSKKLTDIQKEWLKMPCPECGGTLREVDGVDSGFDGEESEQFLWCNSCLLSMDGSGGYTN